MEHQKGTWYSVGDINAFFGLSLDTIAGLVMVVGILVGSFHVPADFVMKCMVPGTAIGVFVGDFLYFVMALIVAFKTQRWSTTSMPLGLDTPSVFGMSYFVLGPAFLHAKTDLGMDEYAAAQYMWEIGIGCVFMAGVFKLACSFASQWARKSFPRAGLLGSLASVALVIISFLPLLEVLEAPLVGLVALSLILTGLIAGVPLPGRIPVVLATLAVAGAMHYAMQYWGMSLYPPETNQQATAYFFPTDWLQVFQMHWVQRLNQAAQYLPVVLPLALATVIGGIDCAESAGAAGDTYPTAWIVGIEASATIIGSLCGGVVQTTPYIGHPAYKAMGGRCAYTLATALFIGSAGTMGFFGYFYQWVPVAAVFPILIFVGLEITAQSFLATPYRHYPAVAISCVPALAFLSVYFVDKVLTDPHVRLERDKVVQVDSLDPSNAIPDPQEKVEPVDDQVKSEAVGIDDLGPKLSRQLLIAKCMARGFIVTSLLWASMLATAIDRRLFASAAFMAVAGFLTLVGVIHSPLPSGSLYLPLAISGLPAEWVLPSQYQPLIWHWSAAYFLCSLLLIGWGLYIKSIGIYGVIHDRPRPHVDS